MLLFSKKKNRKGLQFPKGTIESGETPEQAKDREAFEEVGVHELETYEEAGVYRICKTQKETKHILIKTVQMFVCTPQTLQDLYLPAERDTYDEPVKVPVDFDFLRNAMHHREEFAFLEEHESMIQWYAESFYGYYEECLAGACDS